LAFSWCNRIGCLAVVGIFKWHWGIFIGIGVFSNGFGWYICKHEDQTVKGTEFSNDGAFSHQALFADLVY
jgi:hypothetical protein